jgi:hypothetical protein
MRHKALMLAIAGLLLTGGSSVTAQAPTGAPLRASTGSPAPSPASAQIGGRVITSGGDPIAKVSVRARNLLTGQVSGTTQTASAGQFALNLNPGSYILEVVDGGGQVVGTSSFISAAAGSAITTATVTVTTGELTGVATTGFFSTLGTTAARSVTYAAAAAGVAGVVTPGEVFTASPSR